MLSDEELDRYARHIILPQIGGAGQARLKSAHIAIVGAGGIGCPAIQYLAAAGVGCLTIIDDDRVELSNLHRQLLFTAMDIDSPKASVAARAVESINPHVVCIPRIARLTDSNAATFFDGADIILDGCDNFSTRLAVNRVAMALHIPLLSAAVAGFDVQLALFEGWRAQQPCYACLVGDDPARAAASCADAGVLGALTGLVGIYAALEAVRFLTDFGDSLIGHIILGDLLSRRWRMVQIIKDSRCPTCALS